MDWDFLNSIWKLINEYLIGAFISGVVGLYFAWQSSKQLAKTHQYVAVLLQALEAEDVLHFSRDDNGNPTGVVLHVKAHVTGTSSASANTVVERRIIDAHDSDNDRSGTS